MMFDKSIMGKKKILIIGVLILVLCSVLILVLIENSNKDNTEQGIFRPNYDITEEDTSDVAGEWIESPEEEQKNDENRPSDQEQEDSKGDSNKGDVGKDASDEDTSAGEVLKESTDDTKIFWGEFY